MTSQWWIKEEEVTRRTCTDCSTLDTGSELTTIPEPSSYSYVLRFPLAEVFHYKPFFLPQGQSSYALLWPQRICGLRTVFTMHCISMGWDDGMHGTERAPAHARVSALTIGFVWLVLLVTSVVSFSGSVCKTCCVVLRQETSTSLSYTSWAFPIQTCSF